MTGNDQRVAPRGGRKPASGSGPVIVAATLSGVSHLVDRLAELEPVPETEIDRPRPDRSEVASLVESAAAGDRRAWDGLVDAFVPTVWATARAHRLSATDAADVCHTTWLRLVENLHRIEQPDQVGAWLGVTAHRESLRVLRLGSGQHCQGAVKAGTKLGGRLT